MDNNNQNNLSNQQEMSGVDQSMNPVAPPEKPESNNSKLIIVILAISTALALLLAGFFYWQNTQLKNKYDNVSEIETVTNDPTTTTPSPTASDLPDDTDANLENSARTISYTSIPGWPEFTSSMEYSFQYPPRYSDINNTGEVYSEDYLECSLALGDNTGGVLSATVVPYDGGSRRSLVGIEEGYEHKFEEVEIQGKNSLLIERGPVGESGSAAIAVIPNGHGALILSLAYASIADEDFGNILKSVQLPSDFLLSSSSCGN